MSRTAERIRFLTLSFMAAIIILCGLRELQSSTLRKASAAALSPPLVGGETPFHQMVSVCWSHSGLTYAHPR